MDDLQVSNIAAQTNDVIQHGGTSNISAMIAPDHSAESLTSWEQDDIDLQQLGYKSVLARGWGSFDNFACSFSALYCIGGIRVLFYIALSNGGPAAMYVVVINHCVVSQILTQLAIAGAHGFLVVSSPSSPQQL
jgi:hypothetical protein